MYTRTFLKHTQVYRYIYAVVSYVSMLDCCSWLSAFNDCGSIDGDRDKSHREDSAASIQWSSTYTYEPHF